MSLVFLTPSWLWLLLALPLLALARGTEFVRGHLWLRALTCALVVLGLARPVFWTESAAEHAVLVADFSASVDPSARAALETILRDVAESPSEATRTTLIVLGTPSAPIPGFANVELLRDGSSLSAALAAAVLAIPAAARGSVTILSDGAATDRRWGDAIATLSERRIPIHVVALPLAPRPLRVASVRAMQELQCGQAAEFLIHVTGPDGVAEVEFGAVEGARESASVQIADGEGRLRMSWEPQTAGFLALEARVAGHAVRRNFAVQDPLRVLYLGSRTLRGGDSLAELLGPGFGFDADTSAETPQSRAFRDYDLVVLDDLPAEEISHARQEELREAVTGSGTGLFFSGGRGAYGPGGWHDAPAAALLPVESLQKEEKRDPSTTLVIIIDTSGSMGGERIQLAKEVARLAMMRLLPHDKVGIVEFYGAKRWAAPIQPASNSIDLQRAINRMDAGGGTVILPAIEEAYYGMQNVQTRYKHVLVLTDGGVETGAFEPLLRRMADDGMNVSTVLIGPEAHSEFLLNLANWGRGRFYNVPDRFNLPEILLKQPTSSRLPGYKPGSFPVRAHGGAGWWGETDPHAAPPVAGFAETRARPQAEVLMEIAGEGAPLLASWHHGLGRVTALTTEAVGSGTEPWRAWPEYGTALARVLARTASRERSSFVFTLTRRGEELELRAVRRRESAEQPWARLLGEERALDFDQRAENLFLTRWHADADEEVRLLAGSSADLGNATTRRLAAPREDEYEELAVPPSAELLLAGVAAATGGDLRSLAEFAAAPPRAGGPETVRGARDATAGCFLLALLSYLFDLFHRRRTRRALA